MCVRSTRLLVVFGLLVSAAVLISLYLTRSDSERQHPRAMAAAAAGKVTRVDFEVFGRVQGM